VLVPGPVSTFGPPGEQAKIRAESKKKKPNQKLMRGWSQNIAAAEGQVASLEAENQQLGGKKDTVGAGGEIATIAGQLGAAVSGNALTIAEGGGTSATGLYDLLGTVGGGRAR
jgi:hypothetical protein